VARSSRNPADKYDRLAGRYDGRWAFYLRATTEATLQRVDLRRGESLLDVGCGTGALLDRLAEKRIDATLAGVDPSHEMLATARSKLPSSVRLARAFAEALPFAAETFDVVVSNSAFHYFANPVRALEEIRRVLKPRGRLVVTDWCDDYLACRLCSRWLRWFDPAHTGIFGSNECRELIESAGLTLVEIERYKISWLWGLMTATATNGARDSEVARSDSGARPRSLVVQGSARE